MAAELDRCRHELRRLVETTPPDQLRWGSDGTRWTNGQLLFHMVFGFLVVRRLLPLVRLVSRLPAPLGRGFARLLDAAAGPFHVVNYLGSCGGALLFHGGRLAWLGDRVVTRLQADLRGETSEGLRRGMPFPTRWDPYFTAWMTIEDVYRYPVLHFDHHRSQLTVAGRGRRVHRGPAG